MHVVVPWLRHDVPVIVGWLTLALVNAGLAQGKNRRGWVWFLISLPLGPIATLLLVTQSRARQRWF